MADQDKAIQYYYSPGSGGFYRSDIHGESIPSDAKAITPERHAQLLSDQAEGKTIKASSSGKPMATTVKPSTEQIARNLRQRRDAALRESDVLLIRALEDGQDMDALKSYRNQLRDLPTLSGWPKVDLPAVPT